MRKDIANKPTIEVAYSHSPKSSRELYEEVETAIGNITDTLLFMRNAVSAGSIEQNKDGIISLCEILEHHLWDKVFHNVELMDMRLGEQEKLNGVPR